MAPEHVEQIVAALEDESDEIHAESGFGLVNTSRRIKLYYGRQYGLFIESAAGRGTRVGIVIPRTTGDGDGNDGDEG
jgi:two-component system sensor histidine kinase YesM